MRMEENSKCKGGRSFRKDVMVSGLEATENRKIEVMIGSFGWSTRMLLTLVRTVSGEGDRSQFTEGGRVKAAEEQSTSGNQSHRDLFLLIHVLL